jgi:molybdopterin-binding protein
MEISARNQLPGIIRETTSGAVMAEVVVDVEASTVVAAITRGSLESLGLKAGDKVKVIIKATEVIIGK